MSSPTHVLNLAAVSAAPHHYAVANTVNEAGGLAFRKSPGFELISLMFSTLLAKGKDKFYLGETEVIDKLKTLVKRDPLFAAKAALFARRVLGLRSISHVVAAMVCHDTKGAGQTWVKQFVQAVVYRPDDAIEIVAAYFHLYANGLTMRKPDGKRGKKIPVTLPNPLKKGIAAAISQMNGYQLAKYQKTNQPITLVDLFNITHPKPTAENAADFRAFVKGELKNTDTWESRVSEAGSSAIKKEEAWCGLLEQGKLGYFAALRNSRNILEHAPGAVDALIALLENEPAIRRCLILPFQFMRGYQEVQKCGLPRASEVARAIERAMEVACKNIPVLPGETLVVLDNSGSMGLCASDGTPANIGSLFAAMILKSQPTAEYMAFSGTAKVIPVNKFNTLFGLARSIRDAWISGGTNFHAIFETAKKRYDNIIILSDGEGWMNGGGGRWLETHGAPTTARRQYEQRYAVRPFITMFDLEGSGTMMFPEESVCLLTGFSEKVFVLLRELRKNPAALLDEVAKVDFAAINEEDEG